MSEKEKIEVEETETKIDDCELNEEDLSEVTGAMSVVKKPQKGPIQPGKRPGSFF